MEKKPIYQLEEKEDKGLFSKLMDSKITKIASILTVSIGLTLGYVENSDAPLTFEEVKHHLTGRSLAERMINKSSEDLDRWPYNLEYEEIDLDIDDIPEIGYDVSKDLEKDWVRRKYIESQIKRLEKTSYIKKPENLKGYLYREDFPSDNSYIMRVAYSSINPAYKGIQEVDAVMIITPKAFELDQEDDFLSTILHEYNHVRAFNRKEILDENKYYTEKESGLKWRDLYREELYDHEFDNFYKEIRENIRTPILEILATKEQKYLHENILEVSDAYDELINRYQKTNLNQLESSLERFGAVESLYEELKIFFEE